MSKLKNKKDNKNQDSYVPIVDKIEEKELKEFVVSLIESDEKIYDLFRRHFNDDFPNLSIFEYKKRIRKAYK